MLTNCKTVAVQNNVYTVKLTDDLKGETVVSFVMPYFDQAAFERIIAIAHEAWTKEKVFPPLPVASIERVKTVTALASASAKIEVDNSDFTSAEQARAEAVKTDREVITMKEP